jgi:ribosomal protein L24E
MKNRQQPEFAELMIVNPIRPGSGTVYLGEDGAFYHIQGFGPVEERPPKGQLFMSGDGTLYRLQGFGRTGRARFARVAPADLTAELGEGFGRFFLGEDGSLYELTE